MGKVKKIKQLNTKTVINNKQNDLETTINKEKTSGDKRPKKNLGVILFSNNNPISKKIINKKEKLKNKKKKLQKKIDLIKEQQKKEIARKKREKTVITGDLNPLKDALPSLDELLKLKPTEIKTGLEGSKHENDDGKKLSKIKRDKKRKKELMNRINCFQTLLKDPDYKENPRDTIAFHIRHKNNIEI